MTSTRTSPERGSRRARIRSKRRRPHATLNTTLHAGQREIAQTRARFRVVACGRQWGKTRLGCPLAIWYAAKGKRGFWVAPDYKRANIGWEILKGIADQFPSSICTIRVADRKIEFSNGGWVEVRSAHIDGQLRAPTLDFAIIDEGAFMDRERWDQELRPTLAVRQGWALFLSTFKGENWFHALYMRGLDPEFPDWQAWRHPSVDNPYFSADELELARRETPEAEFRQEYEADPIVYVGAVFDAETVNLAVERGATIEASEATERDTFLGIDWGYTNPTVVMVFQEHPTTGEIFVVEEHAWTLTQLETRIQNIVEIARKYKALGIYADHAGKDENVSLAAAIAEGKGRDPDLRGCDGVVQVRFNKHKVGGIKTRRWYLENNLEHIGPGCREYARTSKAYHYKESKSGDSQEGVNDVVKKDDHHVDAGTAFYASRRRRLVGE